MALGGTLGYDAQKKLSNLAIGSLQVCTLLSAGLVVDVARGLGITKNCVLHAKGVGLLVAVFFLVSKGWR